MTTHLDREAVPAGDPLAPLDGRVALVTGGSRGIGAAISRALAGAGGHVVVNFRNDEAAARALAGELGSAASLAQADIGVGGEAERLVDGVVDRHGRLDVLVLNAGVWRGGRVDELHVDDWDLVLRTTLTASFRMLRRATPVMRAGGWGRVVVVGSVVGLVGFAGDSAYASAKAGLIGLVRSVAKEVGRDGVTVNAVAPGLVETAMTADVDERVRRRMIDRTVLRRPGTATEVAAAVRFLVCDAPYTTGEVLLVDGGFTL